MKSQGVENAGGSNTKQGKEAMVLPKDQCTKLIHKNQQAPSNSSPAAISPTSSITSFSCTSGPTQQHTCSLPRLCPSAPMFHFVNSISSTQQQSNLTIPAIKQQYPVGEDEEYDEFYESQRFLNFTTVINKMPGPNQ
ncbi:hypothetical protein QOT17_007730 [Balamuthia mandrillaris]